MGANVETFVLFLFSFVLFCFLLKLLSQTAKSKVKKFKVYKELDELTIMCKNIECAMKKILNAKNIMKAKYQNRE